MWKCLNYFAVFVAGVLAYPFLVVPFILTFLPEGVIVWWLTVLEKRFVLLGF
jgi:hypothetical protein